MSIDWVAFSPGSALAGGAVIGGAATLLALAGTPEILIEARHPVLVIAGLLVGVGWGLAGFCPGPALVALGAAETD